MEYALRKYSQIAIILSDVLDYDTVKHLIKMLKKDEIDLTVEIFYILNIRFYSLYVDIRI